LIIWASVATILLIGVVGYEVLRAYGKLNLASKSVTSSPMMAAEGSSENYATLDNSIEWQDDWIRYNGDIYEYNKDITTFLIMGIDKEDEVKIVEEGTDGGQADALFLLVFNPHEEKIKVIGINRNSMTDVDIYDEYGNYVTTVIAQIAVQHGFGNGVEESCEYQVKAVSNLFYQLPIHGYAAINMSAIATINDSIGGVSVKVLEDLTKWDDSLKKGEMVHLEGESAFTYVKTRDMNEYGSSDMRYERQKQYLNAFIAAARLASKDDPKLAIDIYNAISSQMTTNISIDEISYLVSSTDGYSFESDDLITIDGQNTMGEEFEEFYIDEEDLYDKFINVFYEKVEGLD
nr:LCP family protein [Butyrivibrio sp.]